MRDYCHQLMKNIETALQAFPFDSKEAYGNLMAQTYYFTSHSVRLLGLALSRTSVNDKEFFKYFSSHIKEEENHEKLALADVNALGFDIKQFPELPICRMLWEPQYYKVNYIGAPVLLGYILVLESVALNFASDMATKAKRLDSSTVNRFMKVHGEEDVAHVAMGFDVLNAMDSSLEKDVKNNMDQTAWGYATMLNLIADTTKK